MSEPDLHTSSTGIGTPPKTTALSGVFDFSRSVTFNLIVPLALLAIGVVAFYAFGTVENEKRPDPDTTLTGRLRALPPVRVAKLEELDSTGRRLQLAVDGVVVPFQEARVAAEVAGRVVFKDAACEAGSYVTADQLLMRIDDADYQIEKQRLMRLVEQEQQSIKELDQELQNTNRLIDVATKDVELQQKEVNRLAAMPEGFASRAEVDQANRALLSATQQLVTVENQYDLLNQRRVRLQASLKLAETQLRAAELNLERTEIRAPIEGVIASEEADLNTFVARGATLVTIENTSKVEVASSLRMDQLYWVLDQAGQKVDPNARGYDLPETPVLVEYELSGREDVVYRWQGRLLSYDGIGLDPETRTVPVRVLVDNPRQYVDTNGMRVKIESAPALLRGMYVRVILLLRPRSSLVVIPAEALQPGNRVLQFLPDESVLQNEDVQTATESDSPDEPATEPRAAPETESVVQTVDDRGEFNPMRWQPGRVVVRREVYPVDALQLGTGSSGDRLGISRQKKWWVCEVPGNELAGGSYVVVSPMGDIDEGDEIAVRADRDGMAEPLGDTRAMAPSGEPSTSAEVSTSAEDA